MNNVFESITEAKQAMRTTANKPNHISGSFIVGYDLSVEDETGVLVIGTQKNNKVDVINAYQDKEAVDLYKKLLSNERKDEVKENVGNEDN